MLQEATAKIDEYARGMISGSGSTLFEELGLYYIGPIDGHNLDLIIAMLQGAALLTSARPFLDTFAVCLHPVLLHHHSLAHLPHKGRTHLMSSESQIVLCRGEVYRDSGACAHPHHHREGAWL